MERETLLPILQILSRLPVEDLQTIREAFPNGERVIDLIVRIRTPLELKETKQRRILELLNENEKIIDVMARFIQEPDPELEEQLRQWIDEVITLSDDPNLAIVDVLNWTRAEVELCHAEAAMWLHPDIILGLIRNEREAEARRLAQARARPLVEARPILLDEARAILLAEISADPLIFDRSAEPRRFVPRRFVPWRFGTLGSGLLHFEPMPLEILSRLRSEARAHRFAQNLADRVRLHAEALLRDRGSHLDFFPTLILNLAAAEVEARWRDEVEARQLAEVVAYMHSQALLRSQALLHIEEGDTEARQLAEVEARLLSQALLHDEEGLDGEEDTLWYEERPLDEEPKDVGDEETEKLVLYKFGLQMVELADSIGSVAEKKIVVQHLVNGLNCWLQIMIFTHLCLEGLMFSLKTRRTPHFLNEVGY